MSEFTCKFCGRCERYLAEKRPDERSSVAAKLARTEAKINHFTFRLRWRDGSRVEDRVVLLARGANWPGHI